MTVGDGSAECRADQGVRKVVHPYTMVCDLAARPVQP
jgi:hypothetical protein